MPRMRTVDRIQKRFEQLSALRQHIAAASEIDQMIQDFGLSISDVCREADLSPPNYYRWRAGQSDLRMATYLSLLDAIAKLAAIIHPQPASTMKV